MFPLVPPGASPLEPQAWANKSEWVLGRPVDVWAAVFETAFLVRARALISTEFAQVRL